MVLSHEPHGHHIRHDKSQPTGRPGPCASSMEYPRLQQTTRHHHTTTTTVSSHTSPKGPRNWIATGATLSCAPSHSGLLSEANRLRGHTGRLRGLFYLRFD